MKKIGRILALCVLLLALSPCLPTAQGWSPTP